MRLINTILGSAVCALALIASPLNAKDKPAGAPAECRCKPDSCKCEKKKVCKCPEASCTCEKCKSVRANQPAPNAPAAKPAASADNPMNCGKEDDDDDDDDKEIAANAILAAGNHCGKCDKKDGDKPETCPDKAPCCPKDNPAPGKECLTVDNHCGKCDKKDGDKPETCPDKAPCCPAESPAK